MKKLITISSFIFISSIISLAQNESFIIISSDSRVEVPALTIDYFSI